MELSEKNNTNVIDAILFFADESTGRITKIEIIENAMKTFKQLFESDKISLFMLDKNSFDFYYLTSFHHNEENAKRTFDEANDNGAIAQALNEGRLQIFQPKSSRDNKIVCIIPLLASDGIMGIIIVEALSLDLKPVVKQTLMLFSKIFALALENCIMTSDKETERERNEQLVSSRLHEIVEGVQGLKKILDHVQVGILMINVPDRRIIDANQLACDMIGVPVDSLIGLDRNKFLLSTPWISGTKDTFKDFESFLERGNGTIMPILRNSVKVEMNGEEFYLESFVDISERIKLEDELHKSHFELEQKVEERTELLKDTNDQLLDEIIKRKETEEELLKARDKAEESNRIKTALLANMSHEFRTPLISILGFSELLSNDLAETDQKDMTQHIHSSGLRLLNTLDGVLRLSQLQTHTYPVNLIECDIIPIVHDLAKKFEIKANEKGLKFKTSLSTSSLLLVVDPVLFSDSIGNLLENGIKFTESGEIILSVFLEGDQFACISVNDTGIGIDSRDYDLVFEEFRQTSEGYKRNYDGCGLGLTLTKGIIEIMNGSIALSSEVGIGSKFSVYLPLINKPIKI